MSTRKESLSLFETRANKVNSDNNTPRHYISLDVVLSPTFIDRAKGIYRRMSEFALVPEDEKMEKYRMPIEAARSLAVPFEYLETLKSEKLFTFNGGNFSDLLSQLEEMVKFEFLEAELFMRDDGPIAAASILAPAAGVKFGFDTAKFWIYYTPGRNAQSIIGSLFTELCGCPITPTTNIKQKEE